MITLIFTFLQMALYENKISFPCNICKEIYIMIKIYKIICYIYF